MDEEQALQFARNAAEKAMTGMKTEASVRMRLKDEVPTVLESKIGGMPYFPAGAAIPLDGNGNPLRFLMQIRCSDVQGIDCFPRQGMLQFWIAADDTWGMCDPADKGYRVIYFDQLDAPSEAAPITEMNGMEREFFPLKGEFGVSFELTEDVIPECTEQYEAAFCRHFNEASGESISSMYDLYSRLRLPLSVLEAAVARSDSSRGHRIGGSSDFCQYDPRETDEMQQRYDFQLLQLSSDFGRVNGKNYENIMWGDAGIGHFFINRKKLKNADFSDILYWCDCC